MSLAELFGIKETWRQRIARARLARHWSFVTRQSTPLPSLSPLGRGEGEGHASPITRHFSLESLEPRLLLSAAPATIAADLSALSIQHSAFSTSAEAPLVLLENDTPSGGDALASTADIQPQAAPAEPTLISAIDRPNDAGGAITLT